MGLSLLPASKSVWVGTSHVSEMEVAWDVGFLKMDRDAGSDRLSSSRIVTKC